MKKVLIFGGAGLVGSKFINLNKEVFEIKFPTVSEADILNKEQILKAIEQFNPDSVVNFAAFTNVEEAEKQTGDENGICFQVNAKGAQIVAEAVKSFNKHLIHISTEYVFDGTKEDSPYTEEDEPNPVNWYGATKLFGEEYILETGCSAAIVRISMPFSSFYKEKKDIARFFLQQLQTGNKIKAIGDQRVTPTLVNDIANALRIIIDTNSGGLYHVSATDSVSPLEFVKTIAEVFKLDYSLIESLSFDEYNKKKQAKLLKFSWLNPAKFDDMFGEGILHTVEEDLVLFKKEIDPDLIGIDYKAGNQI